MKASMPSRAGENEDDDDGDDDDDDVTGETEDLPSPPISDVEDAFLGSGSDEDTPTAFEGKHGDNLDSGHDDHDDDEASLPEASDDDDLLDLAEDSVDLIEYNTTDSGADEWTGLGGSVDVADNKRKRNRGGNDGPPARKKKLRSLPTFASYEDYARMIEDGPQDYL